MPTRLYRYAAVNQKYIQKHLKWTNLSDIPFQNCALLSMQTSTHRHVHTHTHTHIHITFSQCSCKCRCVMNDIQVNFLSTDQYLPCYSLETGYLYYFGKKLGKIKIKTYKLQISQKSSIVFFHLRHILLRLSLCCMWRTLPLRAVCHVWR